MERCLRARPQQSTAQVRVGVSRQQHRLKEEHAGGPDRWPAAEPRQDVLGDQRLSLKQQKGMEVQKGKIDALDAILSDPQTYETESTANLSNMMQKKAKLENKLRQAETRWYTATEEIEKLKLLGNTKESE